MKNLKYLLGILILVSLIIFSCSKDEIIENETSDSSMLRSKQSVDSLATFFKVSIYRSDEYNDFKNIKSIMVDKLNLSQGSNFNQIKTKSDFIRWVNENLSSTRFTNSTEAEQLWDESIAAVENLFRKYGDFYSELSKCSVSEILIILEPEITESWPIESNFDEQGCLDYVSGALAEQANHHAAVMANISFPMIGEWYVEYVRNDSAVKSIIATFNWCIDQI